MIWWSELPPGPRASAALCSANFSNAPARQAANCSTSTPRRTAPTLTASIRANACLSSHSTLPGNRDRIRPGRAHLAGDVHPTRPNRSTPGSSSRNSSPPRTSGSGSGPWPWPGNGAPSPKRRTTAPSPNTPGRRWRRVSRPARPRASPSWIASSRRKSRPRAGLGCSVSWRPSPTPGWSGTGSCSRSSNGQPVPPSVVPSFEWLTAALRADLGQLPD